ncbi:TetR/AcrR family transcriptional regulator [Ancylobacter pratisalsi]|uniref:TetR/AcrR family transcriptional regulator n=1 Tax=Ancylobacter pratisalsi TaxID=1745854 RepID=A0A6P1YN62_9HYPH|nr:TetR/AcrR family transcriptional regulator [Ancylobacter pratisalsi]QIB34146.1 TetR/AcrR family transcriptional regulator [Ancylobacter pratisalsi]
MIRPVAGREQIVARLGELFREHGYEGASLSLISARTGLGKGSLYHFFPGGKEEMAGAVLADIDGWFEREIFAPLRQDDAVPAIADMFDAVDRYFQSGRRACLVGAFALGQTRGRFAVVIEAYFWRWQGALANALARAGHRADAARDLAEEVVGGIQGGLILAHALDDDTVFTRALARLRARCAITG